jgi:hypothetical protein
MSMKKNISASSKGYHFPPESMSHCVWLYFRFSLSYRDVEEIMAERGVVLASETVRECVSEIRPDLLPITQNFRVIGTCAQIQHKFCRDGKTSLSLKQGKTYVAIGSSPSIGGQPRLSRQRPPLVPGPPHY